jgi:ESS family glutamate:Na+ symporter
MDVWTLDISIGTFLMDFTFISVLFIVATLIRRYVPFIQNYLVPNNIIAGFLGLAVASLGFAYFDDVSIRMGAYVYHLLALTFIAVTLSEGKKTLGKAPALTGIMLVIVYLIQALLGMLITFALIYTVFPDLFPGFGMLMPLAFGMGPGISYAIAHGWEPAGFLNGGVTGLTIAAVGLLIAYISGIIIVRFGIRKGKASLIKGELDLSPELKRGILKPTNRPSAGSITTATEAIEPLTFHMAMVGLVYALTYGLMLLLEHALIAVGAGSEVNTLWSFHFIIATIVGIFARNLIDYFELGYLIDENLMTRNANLFVDFMIAASITAISAAVVVYYALPIVLCCVVAGLVTYWFTKWASYHYFKDYKFERFASIFSDTTGTIQSALVLLRVLDPKFKTKTGLDLVYGSGIALLVGFPLLVLINAPVNFFDDLMVGYWYVVMAMAGYLLMLLLSLRFIGKQGK